MDFRQLWDERDLLAAVEHPAMVELRPPGTRQVYGVNAIREFIGSRLDDDTTAKEKLLGELSLPEGSKAFLRNHKIAVRATDGTITLQPKVVGATKGPLEDYDDVAGVPKPVELDQNGRPVERKYSLYQLFTDTSVIDRFGLSQRAVQQIKRVAVVDAVKAVSLANAQVRRSGHHGCRIIIGDYDKSKKRCSQTIFAMADKIQYPDNSAQACVTNDKLHISFDEFGTGSVPVKWTASAPLKFSRELMAVYQLSVVHGPDRIIGVLSQETLQLGIEIYDHTTGSYHNGVLDGYADLDGIDDYPDPMPRSITADQALRLTAAGRWVVPVNYQDRVVGTAVRVSDDYVILNEHTRDAIYEEGAQVVVGGVQISSPLVVGEDVCAGVYSSGATTCPLRPARLGERVVLVFSLPSSVGYSEVLTVSNIMGGRIILTDSMVVRHGCSGAAAVALSDGALLGIFSTRVCEAGSAGAVHCSAFSASMFAEVIRTVEVTPSEAEDVAAADGGRMYERMRRRGLVGRVTAAVASVVPLRGESGDRIGFGCNSDGHLYTTVDTEAQPVTDASGAAVQFALVDGSVARSVVPYAGAPVAGFVRVPVRGERAFVVGLSDSGQVVMTGDTYVTLSADSDGTFRLGEIGTFPAGMRGALVLAVSDGSILGMYDGMVWDYQSVVLSCRVIPVSRGDPERGTEQAEIVSGAMQALEVEWSRGAMADLVNMGRRAIGFISMHRRAALGLLTMYAVSGRDVERWCSVAPAVFAAQGFRDQDLDKYGSGADPYLALLAILYVRNRDWLEALVADQLFSLSAPPTPVTPVSRSFPRARSVSPVAVSAAAGFATSDAPGDLG